MMILIYIIFICSHAGDEPVVVLLVGKFVRLFVQITEKNAKCLFISSITDVWHFSFAIFCNLFF